MTGYSGQPDPLGHAKTALKLLNVVLGIPLSERGFRFLYIFSPVGCYESIDEITTLL